MACSDTLWDAAAVEEVTARSYIGQSRYARAAEPPLDRYRYCSVDRRAEATGKRGRC